nr:unnamed protein product [Callosobruchus chinensis]CAH7767573.1 unnamed protein product [Callosobruchus chinensis]
MECIKCKKVDNEPAGCECLIHQECSELSSAELKVMALRSRRLLKFYCTDCQLGLKLVPRLSRKVDELFAEVERLKALVGNLPSATAELNFEEVIRETEERSSRKQNLIVYGLPENGVSKQEQEAQDDNKIKKMLELISPDARPTMKPFRLGKFDPTRDKPRPVKIVLLNNLQVQQCVRNVSKLKANNSYRGINISFDKTPKQVEYYKQIREQLNRRIEAGENNLRIKHVRGIPIIVSEN